MHKDIASEFALLLLASVAVGPGTGCGEGHGTLSGGNAISTGGAGVGGATAGTAATCAGAGSYAFEVGGSCGTTALPGSFTWKSSGPLIGPVPDASHDLVSIKDPTVVFFNDRWHVYATTADTGGSWNMVYLSFADWNQAASAPQYYMNRNRNLTGYHCAPELFYFTPQNKWYLIYVSGPPQYSTADDPSQPGTWTAPQNFSATEPAIVTANKGSGTWLDFWVICDAANCYMFFSDDNGHWYRSQTTIGDFPNGFADPVIALADTKANLFEASNVYQLKGTNKYLAMIEAFGPSGRRYFRSWTADSLDGSWTPLADTWTNPFAGQKNVSFDACSPAWTLEISHGEIIRDGYDETLTIDPCHIRFLYQGVEIAQQNNSDYSQIPWQLGLLSQTN
jgi:endo-1,4-beta-xylanase